MRFCTDRSPASLGIPARAVAKETATLATGGSNLTVFSGMVEPVTSVDMRMISHDSRNLPNLLDQVLQDVLR